MMRALKHGVPMLVMPGIAPDQPINAARVEELGAGRVLSQDADSDAIGSAARELLTTSQYRAQAQRLSRRFRPVDGAAGAADEVEKLLLAHRGRSRRAKAPAAAARAPAQNMAGAA
jgi:UDP:flavonoid glycosyltransferase YjiC (YdhE family)